MKKRTWMHLGMITAIMSLSACGKETGVSNQVTEQLDVEDGIVFQMLEDELINETEQNLSELILTAEDIEGMSERSVALKKYAKIYAKSSTESAVIGEGGRGEVLTVYKKSEDGNWYIVSYNGRIGYVKEDCMEDILDDNDSAQNENNRSNDENDSNTHGTTSNSANHQTSINTQTTIPNSSQTQTPSGSDNSQNNDNSENNNEIKPPSGTDNLQNNNETQSPNDTDNSENNSQTQAPSDTDNSENNSQTQAPSDTDNSENDNQTQIPSDMDNLQNNNETQSPSDTQTQDNNGSIP